MNFTLEKKFKLALICVAIQLLMWITGLLFPLLPYTLGDVFTTFYRILCAFSALGLLPFFFSVLQNRNLIFRTTATEGAETIRPESASLIQHIATRLGSMLLIFGFSYLFILTGAVDSGGYGIIYAGIVTVVLVLIALIIDAIIIYRKEKDSSRFYTNIFLISAFLIGSFRLIH